MRKHQFFALILFALLTVPGLAQTATFRNHHGGGQHSNTLTVVSTTKQGFWLFVDDVLQNENPVHSVCVTGFLPEMFHVRVELDNKMHNCVGQYVDMSRSQGVNICYSEGVYSLEFTKTNVRPELTMNLVMQQMPLASQNSHIAPPPAPAPGAPAPGAPVPGGPAPVDPCMNNDAFNALCNEITESMFDGSKVGLAKDAAYLGTLCSRQIGIICRMFDFEGNKLEFAEYAYEYCPDKENYHLVFDAFAYDSSKRKLREYIKAQ